MAEPREVGRVLTGTGGLLLLAGVVGPFTSDTGAWMSTGRAIWLGLGAILVGLGYAARAFTGERAKQPIIPIMGLVAVLILLIVAVLWTVEVPVPGKIVDGEVITSGAEASGVQGLQVKVLRPISSTTTIPWTIIAAVSIIVYGIFRIFGASQSGAIKKTLTVLWLLSFPLLLLVLLRNPEWDLDAGVSTYLPALVVFSVIGVGLMWFVSKPGVGELGRVVGALVLIVAFASFLVPMPFLFRFLLLALALFTLAGPTFGGEGWKGLAGAWMITVLLITFFVFATTTDSGIDVPGSFFLGGLSLTIVLAFTSIVLSFPIGVLLALGRTSTMPIFRLLSTAYIELVRGVPLITWLLVAFLMLPVALPTGVELGGVIRAIGAMTFFSAAYLAENVRGGLQSVAAGQREASRALGMSTVQMIVFITLPQALRAVIPALVGQVIALFKDTSLVTIVGLFDFLHIARQIVPSQSQPFSFLGSIKETLIFAAIVYWLFTFTFSRISLRLEKRLGVGER